MLRRLASEGVEHPVFEYLDGSISRLCRENEATLIRWYHSEPRWLIYWEQNPLREVEISFETLRPTGHVKRFRLAVIPSIFEKSWQFGSVRYIDVNTVPNKPWPYLDPSQPVNLKEFETSLCEAIEEANMLAGASEKVSGGNSDIMTEQKNNSRSLSTEYSENSNSLLKKTYQRLRDVVSDRIIGGLIETVDTGNPSIISDYHAYDILRNLDEIKALQQMGSFSNWVYNRRSPSLTPEDIGALLTPYVTFIEGTLSGFKLSESPDEPPMVCAFDSAIRLAAYNVRRGIRNGKDSPVLILSPSDEESLHITAEDLDKIAATFIKQCKSDGTIASAPGGIASLFSAFVALEITHSITSESGLRVQNSECARLIKEWSKEILEKMLQLIVTSNKSTGAATCAFSYESGGKACNSANYYALRALSHLDEFNETSLNIPDNNTNGKGLIRDIFQGDRQVCEKESFLNFLRLSRDPNCGGFSRRPNEQADIVHTRYVLQLLRSLLSYKVISLGEVNWLNLFVVWDYVMSCYSHGGFALAPLMIPTLYTTRLGVNSIKLLEIFCFHRDLHNGEEYLRRREQFDAIVDDIPRFIDSCKKDGRYTDYSPKVSDEISMLLNTGPS